MLCLDRPCLTEEGDSPPEGQPFDTTLAWASGASIVVLLMVVVVAPQAPHHDVLSVVAVVVGGNGGRIIMAGVDCRTSTTTSARCAPLRGRPSSQSVYLNEVHFVWYSIIVLLWL